MENPNNEPLELEFKYDATNIKLSDFEALLVQLGSKKKLERSSWDLYYTLNERRDFFARYRKSDETPELTKKKRLKESVWERIEADLPLDPKRIDEKQVKDFLDFEGMKENFRIFKSCFIYYFDNLNYVYYTVYDKNMKEVGRYVEVEVNKDKVAELGATVKDVLKEGEQKLLAIGITPQHRLRRALFDIFVDKL